MNKLLLLLALAIAWTANAQQPVPDCPEPDFFGQTYTLLPEGGFVDLDREVIQVNTRESTTSILFGIGKKKTDLVLHSPEAVVRLNADDEIRFVIRVPDNNFDPVSVINIFRFKQDRKRRKAETSSVSTFGSVKVNNFERLRYKAIRYGVSSYLITLYERTAGEYGILLNNPSCIMDNSMVVSTFAIED